MNEKKDNNIERKDTTERIQKGWSPGSHISLCPFDKRPDSPLF